MMIRSKKGRPPYPPTLPVAPSNRPLFRIDFWTSFLVDFFSILAPIWAPFWSTFHVFCITFSSIEFASMLDRCFNVILFTKNKKSLVTKLHRFVIDFGYGFGIILGASSHKLPYFFDIVFCIEFSKHFYRKCVPKWTGE